MLESSDNGDWSPSSSWGEELVCVGATCSLAATRSLGVTIAWLLESRDEATLLPEIGWLRNVDGSITVCSYAALATGNINIMATYVQQSNVRLYISCTKNGGSPYRKIRSTMVSIVGSKCERALGFGKDAEMSAISAH